MLARKMLLICLEAALIAGIIGCAPTIVSSDAGVYQHGTLYGKASKDVDAVYAATLAAMDKLQLQVIDKAKDVFAAKVIAKSADGKTVAVKIRPIENNKAAFEIHVGLRNEERAQKVYDEIIASLAIVRTK